MRDAKSLAVATLLFVIAASPVKAQEPPQPKIAPLVWTLLSGAAQTAFPSFTNWLMGASAAVPPQYAGAPVLAGPGLMPATTQPFEQVTTSASPGSAIVTALAGLAGNMIGNAIAGNGTTNLLSPVQNPVILGQPDIPLRTAEGQVNYQGLHLAVVSIGADGQTAQMRSLADGFRTGERFKLRVVSTFDAVAVIDNVNPSGMRNRLYPAPTGGDQVVFLKAGQPVLLPLDSNQFFEFANQTGVEQLLVTVRDPRTAGSLSNQPVYRQDAPWGSNLMQLTPSGTYAGFTQSLSLLHR